MASRSLNRLRVSPLVAKSLQESLGVSTAGDLLQCSPLEVMFGADLSLCEAQSVLLSVSTQIAPPARSALDFLRQREAETRFLATGFHELDAALRGGLLVNSVTDVCGTPGIGKTQFCLCAVLQTSAQLCAHVLYIDAEQKFDPLRLTEIAKETFPESFDAAQNIAAERNMDNMLGRIKVVVPFSTSELEALLDTLETEIITSGAKLVVIDSIAALLRKEQLDETDREKFVMCVATKLKQLAEKCGCCVLATNQVVAASASLQGAECLGESLRDSTGHYVPALGNTWHHAVTTRLLMSRETVSLSSGEPLRGVGAERECRCVRVTKSPMVPAKAIYFAITARGLERDF